MCNEIKIYNVVEHAIIKYWHSEISYANQYAAYSDWSVLNLFTEENHQDTCQS